MNQNEIKDEILSRLGFPVVKVEIDDTQWAHIFKSTKRWFGSKKGVLGCANVQLMEDRQDYDFPPNAQNIIDVVLPLRSDIQSLLSLGFFDIVPLNAMNIGAVTSAFNSYSSYVQILQALESRRRIFGAEPDWYVECNKIWLTSKNLSGTLTSGDLAGHMLVLFTKKDWDPAELKDRDEDLFMRYATNEAKYVLARIRGKYKSPPAAGGSIDMDADDLMAEYKEDKEILDEEISESQGPMGMVTG